MTEDISAAEASAVNDFMVECAEQFAELCEQRHKEGEEKYGAFTWMGNDIVRMMIEELADTVNYCQYQAVKLMMIQAYLEAELNDKLMDGEDVEEITIGVKAFKGTKDVGWSKK